MSDQIIQMAPIIWKQIQKGQKFLLHCHPSPDPDSIGSSLAMMHILKSIGKQVSVISGDSKINPSTKLPGIEEIIPKNYFEINIQEFDTFIILDSSNLEQISDKGKVLFPKNLNAIVIDHHISNTGFGNINLIETNYPATAQILFDLFKIWNTSITPEIASCLFLGLYTDTMFKYFPSDFHTYEVAAELAKIYPDFPKLVFDYENNNTPGRIIFRGLALLGVKTYYSNNLALTVIPFSTLQEYGITREDTEKNDAENDLKSVVGWNMGVKIVEREPGICVFSFRTRDPQKYDVAAIAKLVGGGGHKAASGARIAGSLEEAKAKLFAAIQQLHPELGQP